MSSRRDRHYNSYHAHKRGRRDDSRQPERWDKDQYHRHSDRRPSAYERKYANEKVPAKEDTKAKKNKGEIIEIVKKNLHWCKARPSEAGGMWSDLHDWVWCYADFLEEAQDSKSLRKMSIRAVGEAVIKHLDAKQDQFVERCLNESASDHYHKQAKRWVPADQAYSKDCAEFVFDLESSRNYRTWRNSTNALNLRAPSADLEDSIFYRRLRRAQDKARAKGKPAWPIQEELDNLTDEEDENTGNTEANANQQADEEHQKSSIGPGETAPAPKQLKKRKSVRGLMCKVQFWA